MPLSRVHATVGGSKLQTVDTEDMACLRPADCGEREGGGRRPVNGVLVGEASPRWQRARWVCRMWASRVHEECDKGHAGSILVA